MFSTQLLTKPRMRKSSSRLPTTATPVLAIAANPAPPDATRQTKPATLR